MSPGMMNNIFLPGDPNQEYSKVPDMSGCILSPRGQMLENVVMILNHKSIKNKKHFLDRYAFNKNDMLGVKDVVDKISLLQGKQQQQSHNNNRQMMSHTLRS